MAAAISDALSAAQADLTLIGPGLVIAAGLLTGITLIVKAISK